jgi:hypothetical protein
VIGLTAIPSWPCVLDFRNNYGDAVIIMAVRVEFYEVPGAAPEAAGACYSTEARKGTFISLPAAATNAR